MLPLHRYSFAELMKRVFLIVVMKCATCGSGRRWIAAIASGEAATSAREREVGRGMAGNGGVVGSQGVDWPAGALWLSFTHDLEWGAPMTRTRLSACRMSALTARRSKPLATV